MRAVIALLMTSLTACSSAGNSLQARDAVSIAAGDLVEASAIIQACDGKPGMPCDVIMFPAASIYTSNALILSQQDYRLVPDFHRARVCSAITSKHVIAVFPRQRLHLELVEVASKNLAVKWRCSEITRDAL